jgi:hypothetical protein
VKTAVSLRFYCEVMLSIFYPECSPQIVTNLQGAMEVYRLDQVSKIFAKSV